MKGAIVYRINVSGGGVPKLSVEEAVVGDLGIVGDDHNDRENHGGPLQALCLYSQEALKRLQGEGHPVAPGGMGENITLEGLDVADLHPGDRLRLGEVEIEISDYATPCKTIAGNFIDGRFTRVSEKFHIEDARLYARILRGGHLRRGDPARLIEKKSHS